MKAHLVEIPLGNSFPSHDDFSSGVGSVRDLVVSFLPVNQSGLNVGHGRTHGPASHITILHHRTGAAALCEAVSLNDNWAQTSPDEVVGRVGEGGAANNDKPHVTTK